MNNIPAPLIFTLGCCLVFGKNRSWKLLKIFGTNIIAAQEHSLFVDKTSIGFFRVMENGCLLGHDFLGIGSIFLLYLSWLMYKFQFYLPPTSITIICNLFQEGGPISLPDFIFSWNDQTCNMFWNYSFLLAKNTDYAIAISSIYLKFLSACWYKQCLVSFFDDEDRNDSLLAKLMVITVLVLGSVVWPKSVKYGEVSLMHLYKSWYHNIEISLSVIKCCFQTP